MLIQVIFTLLITGVGCLYLFKARMRSAKDVILDLSQEENLKNIADELKIIKTARFTIGDEYAGAGLLSSNERADFQYQQKLIPFVSLLIVASILLILRIPLSSFIIALIATGSLLYIFMKQRVRKRATAYIKNLEYHLPLVMERLVMAVEAGLDILGSLSVISKLDQELDRESDLKHERDPVTKLLEIVLSLTEAGLTFEQSLQKVSQGISCSALRHAFIHLGNAHRDGGELVMPLRELSDATQLYFQETVEELVAKAPVKATFPLVLTFIGLIICFLTIPIIQVIDTLESTSLPNATTLPKGQK